MPVPLTPESIAKLAADFRARVVSAVNAEADKLLARSQEIVPIGDSKYDKHPGALRDSGRREGAEVDSSSGAISVSVIYGGTPEVPYAAYVHEDPTGQHPKFLERPLMDMESEILGDIAAAVKL